MKQTILVTGGSGFLGIHTILQLLQQGYAVNTTIRSFEKKDLIINALSEAGLTDIKDLSFFEASLTEDAGWAGAVGDCDYVLHIASPFPAGEPAHEDELIVPAREGALRVLKAARDAGVKRVVLTSSFAAIGYSKDTPGHVFTEADWTDERVAPMAYIRSKTIAEKAAWQFMEEVDGMELTVINPVGIFGPVIGGIASASVATMVQGLLRGDIRETPAFTFGVVDVRDVAELHIRAMLHPGAGGQRFLATSGDVMSVSDIAALIRRERPGLGGKMADLQPLDRQRYIRMSNRKAVETFGWQPRSGEKAILASIDTLTSKRDAANK